MTKFRGVILDVDGTLVDSNDAHAHAWVEALAEHGITVEYARLRRMIGMGGDKIIPIVSDLDAESEQGKQITERRSEIFKQRYLPKLNAFRGTRALLEALHQRGLRLAVASSAREDELDPLLELTGAITVIETKTSADDASQSKPEPDIVLAALRTLNMGPTEVVMLGDTPYDVQACQKAGIAIIGVRSGGWNDDELAGSIAVYAHPSDLLDHLDDSPLAA